MKFTKTHEKQIREFIERADRNGCLPVSEWTSERAACDYFDIIYNELHMQRAELQRCADEIYVLRASLITICIVFVVISVDLYLRIQGL